MVNKKYIFWDFNGTILDDVRLNHQIFNEMLTEYRLKPISLEEYLEHFGFPVIDFYKRYFDLDSIPFDELSKLFIGKYQPRSLKESLSPGIADALFYFQSLGVQNVLLSATEQSRLHEQVEHFKIGHYFIDILGTQNIRGESKLHVAINYLKKKKIKPQDVVFIGDTLHDVEVAQAVGCDVLIYTKGHQHKKRLKKVPTIDHFYTLSQYIFKKDDKK